MRISDWSSDVCLPIYLEAMRRAHAGEIGTLRYFRSEHGFVQGDPAKWRLKKALAGGGSLMDIGIYALNAARYMTGEEPIAVYAHEQTARSEPHLHEVEDMIEFPLEFTSGVIGSCMSIDRKSVVKGKRGSGRVDFGGR